jgi:hypothetical protein
MSTNDEWPALEPSSWAPTKRSLHLYAQMLGKLRLALAPHQPNFIFTSLALTPRGFTTTAMPSGTRSLEASLDVFAREMILETSDGRERRISLAGSTTIADVFAQLHARLDELDVRVLLSPIPQEVPDVTPLDRDRRPAAFESLDAQRWLRVVTATSGVFDRWRSHFFGRTGLQLWWGAFDFALLLFNGKHVAAPTTRGYLMRYDLDAEMLNVGFYPGDVDGSAFFYAYVFPQPHACETLAIAPPGAGWSETLGEWVLPYEAVRTSADPAGTLTAFLDSTYAVCADAAGWDRRALSYVVPPLRRSRS